jgi:hypothetical protein
MTKDEARKKLLAGLETGDATSVTALLRSAVPPAIQLVTGNAESRGGNGEERAGAVSATGPNQLTDGISTLTKEIADLRSISQRQVELVESSTRTTVETTRARSASGGSWAGVAKNVVPTLGGVFSLSPLISGLVGLFRGREKEAVDPIQYYVAPQPVAVQAGVTASGVLVPVSYGQQGQPRAVAHTPVTNPPPITIQVQAMDSKSFADHSYEIAKAVRDAMLNGHSLNDVVSEL